MVCYHTCMPVLKRRAEKKYKSVMVSPLVHDEMRRYVASNPSYKGIGNLVEFLWRTVGNRKTNEQ